MITKEIKIMKIGFIGAGKVGSAFGHYLKDRGLEVIGYYSKSKESAINAAKFTGTNYFELKELVNNCEYIFITTPDDYISEVWSKLKSFNLQDKKIFHMSGSISSSIFDDIDNFKAYGYSLHPLFPFSDKNSYIGLDKAVFTIEGKNLAIIKGLLTVSKINYFKITPEQKVKYHAGAVFASNYIVALVKIAKVLFLECGIPEEEALNAIYPMAIGTINSILEKGIEKALTGPIVRGDIGTVMKHQEALTEFKNVYEVLGKVVLGIAIENKSLDSESIKSMNRILGGSDYEKNN